MKNNKIWLSLAKMSGKEMHYVQEAFHTNWVVPLGPNVDAFEKSWKNTWVMTGTSLPSAPVRPPCTWALSCRA
jgi:dTDP-4-amino-4,6-dideoxygalactose transaminase